MSGKTKETRAPRGPVLWSLPIYRVPAGKPKKAMVISRDYFGFETHFYDGRNWSCQAEECLLCDMNVSKRWCGAAVIANFLGSSHHLLIFTRPVAFVFDGIIEEFGSLQGFQCVLGRNGINIRSEMFCQRWSKEPLSAEQRVYSKEEVRQLVDRIFTKK